MTTCTTGKAVSVEDFDGADDGESTTILQASGWGNLLRFERSPAIPATYSVEAGLHQLATDCLRVFCYSFVAFNLAESVSLCALFGFI